MSRNESCDDVKVITSDMKETKARYEAPPNRGGAHTLTEQHSYDEMEDVAQLNANGGISELSVIAEGEERTTWFVWLLVACTSISGLLFGKLYRSATFFRSCLCIDA